MNIRPEQYNTTVDKNEISIHSNDVMGNIPWTIKCHHGAFVLYINETPHQIMSIHSRHDELMDAIKMGNSLKHPQHQPETNIELIRSLLCKHTQTSNGCTGVSCGICVLQKIADENYENLQNFLINVVKR